GGGLARGDVARGVSLAGLLRGLAHDVLAGAVLVGRRRIGDDVNEIELGAILSVAARHAVGFAVAHVDAVVARATVVAGDRRVAGARQVDARLGIQTVVTVAATEHVGAGLRPDPVVAGAAVARVVLAAAVAAVVAVAEREGVVARAAVGAVVALAR